MGVTDWMTSAITGAVRSLVADAADTSGLLLLIVRPLFRSGETVVSFELSANAAVEAGGEDPTLQPWELPFAAFQVKNADAIPSGGEMPALCMPAELTSGLQYRLASHSVRQSKPLWLKLARPYGLLGTVAWEKALGAALARPILRVPDFPDRPVERADVLESALILDAGPDADPTDVARRATEVAQAVLRGSSRPSTRVHVFASARLYRAAREMMTDKRIAVYDPAAAKTSAAAASAQETGAMPLRSHAWVDWVRQSIGDRCLDAVHMVTRAKWSESGAYLIVAASPSPEEMQSALVLVDADEFGLLVNRVGACAVTFTPPSAGCRNDVAFFADRFAHLRTGTVLFNSGQGPEDLEPLRASCQVLFSAKPSPAPALGNGFLYCHPGFIRGETQPDSGHLAALLAGQATLLAERSPLVDRVLRTVTRLVPGIPTRELSGAPVWVAAIQRFLEKAALEAARRAGKDVLLSNVRPGSKDADQQLSAPSEQTIATLAAIQGVLEKYKNPKAGI